MPAVGHADARVATGSQIWTPQRELFVDHGEIYVQRQIATAAAHGVGRVGRGTQVEVFLPEHLGEPSAAYVSPVTLPRGQGQRVLVVDDEEALCLSLTHLLTRLGYQVVAESQPEAALELFTKAPADFALVLTDLTMPGMTGLDLAQRMLQLKPDARVVLMSGFSGSWTPSSVRTLGLIDMLVKPLNAAALAAGVSRALAEPR